MVVARGAGARAFNVYGGIGEDIALVVGNGARNPAGDR